MAQEAEASPLSWSEAHARSACSRALRHSEEQYRCRLPPVPRGVPKSTGCAVVEEIEIYRAANQIIQRHGTDAGFEAAMRADAMIKAGDPEGLAVWKRILKAVDELQRDEPGQGETIQ